jgi:hypothetical protein
MDQPMDLNPIFRSWKKLTSNALLCAHLSKFMKVAKLVMVQIMGFVKNARTFSTLTFMKTRLQNKLYEDRDLVVCMFAQVIYNVDAFPYNDVIIVWINEKVRRGLLA